MAENNAMPTFGAGTTALVPVVIRDRESGEHIYLAERDSQGWVETAQKPNGNARYQFNAHTGGPGSYETNYSRIQGGWITLHPVTDPNLAAVIRECGIMYYGNNANNMDRGSNFFDARGTGSIPIGEWKTLESRARDRERAATNSDMSAPASNPMLGVPVVPGSYYNVLSPPIPLPKSQDQSTNFGAGDRSNPNPSAANTSTGHNMPNTDTWASYEINRTAPLRNEWRGNKSEGTARTEPLSTAHLKLRNMQHRPNGYHEPLTPAELVALRKESSESTGAATLRSNPNVPANQRDFYQQGIDQAKHEHINPQETVHIVNLKPNHGIRITSNEKGEYTVATQYTPARLDHRDSTPRYDTVITGLSAEDVAKLVFEQHPGSKEQVKVDARGCPHNLAINIKSDNQPIISTDSNCEVALISHYRETAPSNYVATAQQAALAALAENDQKRYGDKGAQVRVVQPNLSPTAQAGQAQARQQPVGPGKQYEQADPAAKGLAPDALRDRAKYLKDHATQLQAAALRGQLGPRALEALRLAALERKVAQQQFAAAGQNNYVYNQGIDSNPDFKSPNLGGGKGTPRDHSPA